MRSHLRAAAARTGLVGGQGHEAQGALHAGRQAGELCGNGVVQRRSLEASAQGATLQHQRRHEKAHGDGGVAGCICGHERCWHEHAVDAALGGSCSNGSATVRHSIAATAPTSMFIVGMIGTISSPETAEASSSRSRAEAAEAVAEATQNSTRPTSAMRAGAMACGRRARKWLHPHRGRAALVPSRTTHRLGSSSRSGFSLC